MSQIGVHISSSSFPYKNALYSAEPLGLDVKTVHLLRILLTIFISEVNGLAMAVGNEFLVQCDMRFAGPRARFGVLEVAMVFFMGTAVRSILRILSDLDSS